MVACSFDRHNGHHRPITAGGGLLGYLDGVSGLLGLNQFKVGSQTSHGSTDGRDAARTVAPPGYRIDNDQKL